MSKDRIINLVIVISGNHNRVSSALEYIAKSLNNALKKDYHVYSDYSLWRGEVNHDLLKKSSTISFTTKKRLVDNEYYASPNCFDFDRLISSLYDSKSLNCQIVPDCSPDFNPDLLISKIQKIENSKEQNGYCHSWEELNWCDFVIHYHFEKSHISNSIVTIRYLENNCTIESIRIIKYFKSMMCKLDELFGDVFMSSYISNSNYNSPIVHTGLYGCNYYYNVFNLCHQYILGTEWGIYANNKIGVSNYLNDNNDYNVSRLSNGIFVQFNSEIEDYRDSSRKKMLNDFYDIIIPAYGEYRWSMLDSIEYSGYTIENAYVFSEQPMISGKLVLFNNKLIQADPIIVFSFHVDKETFYENNSSLSDEGLVMEYQKAVID